MDATVLIADGEMRWRDALQCFFSECGFQVETALDGLDWLARAQAIEPDVLVIDLDMAYATAVVAVLNESCPFKMPAVLVVGNAPSEVISEQTGVPLASCFQKSAAMESLLDRVGLAVAAIDLNLAGNF